MENSLFKLVKASGLLFTNTLTQIPFQQSFFCKTVKLLTAPEKKQSFCSKK